MTNDKQIVIFLRQCFYSPCSKEDNRGRPRWFDKEKIFHNLLHTINPELAQLVVVYDEAFGEKKDTFLHYWHTIDINCGNEADSYLALMDIIKNQKLNKETIVYVLEDDYLHRENWCEVLLEGFETGARYVTLYDHPDKYNDYGELKSKIFVTKSCHWRTTPSTTNTFAVKYGDLMEDMNTHIAWSSNTPGGISNDTGRFNALSDEGKLLVSSIPGYSTHVNNQMSPLINWENYV